MWPIYNLTSAVFHGLFLLRVSGQGEMDGLIAQILLFDVRPEYRAGASQNLCSVPFGHLLQLAGNTFLSVRDTK